MVIGEETRQLAGQAVAVASAAADDAARIEFLLDGWHCSVIVVVCSSAFHRALLFYIYGHFIVIQCNALCFRFAKKWKMFSQLR